MTEIIEKKDLMNERLTQEKLSGFMSSEQWFIHPLNQYFTYTDGVKYFAENGGKQGAYWFLDKVACEIAPLLKSKKQGLGFITLAVNAVDQQAVIHVTDGNEQLLATIDIVYTDMQPGDWQFYLVDDMTQQMLLLYNEY